MCFPIYWTIATEAGKAGEAFAPSTQKLVVFNLLTAFFACASGLNHFTLYGWRTTRSKGSVLSAKTAARCDQAAKSDSTIGPAIILRFARSRSHSSA